jgi:hypothetical protein
MEYIIVGQGRSEYGRETHRYINKMESMYRYHRLSQSLHCFKQENPRFIYKSAFRKYAEFEYGSFILGKKRRHTEVRMTKARDNVYMCIY